ncbi:uncharacterized protein LOC134848514 isoform X2 [Symsagittifera roscoffensis]|uniref:uncharacterized protein LOC134848514 isoform X2 n=1 Tax=Symsagittifera roscoffensis TaxID=84072 RepID=UPI00307C4F70
MTFGVLEEVHLTLLEYAGLFVTLCALVAGGFSQYKDWFSVRTPREPSFSVWHVCYNGNWGVCVDPMSLDNQYDYGPAVISSRIFLLLSITTLLFLSILASGSLWGSPKINSVSPVIFVVLCVLALVFQTLGNSIFEGAVRLRVTGYVTPYGMPRIDSDFGWAGYSAWLSFLLTIVSTGIYGSYSFCAQRTMDEMEKLGDHDEE